MSTRIRASLCFVAAVTTIGGLAACSSNGSSAGGKTVEMKITPAGCDPFEVSVPAGTTSFHVVNDGASSISEFEILSGSKIVAEKESLTPGLDATIHADLTPGTYTLACPGGTQHATGTLTVTAAGASGGAAGTNSTSGGEAAGSGAEAVGDCVPTATDQPVTAHVAATLRDYTITLASAQTTTGAVSVDGTNEGTHPHEIVAVKGVAPNALPLDASGKVDEDQLPEGSVAGELEAFTPGKQCSAVLDLSPGTYTLFCNVDDDAGAHAKLGMVTTLNVS